MLEGKNILITGGLGFIGSHLAEACILNRANVIVVDDFSTGRVENIFSGLRPKCEIIRSDFANEDVLRDILPDADIIFHMAAHLEIFESIADPIKEINENVAKTVRLLEMSRKYDVENFIFSSSACVYGQARKLPLKEECELRPNWPYGVSKLAAEKYCLMYHELYGLKTVALRYGIVYGPREWYGRVLPIFVRRALTGRPLLVFGDGKQRRDFVHVDDVVKANLFSVDAKDTYGEAINVGTGVGTTVKDLAKMVSSRVGGSEIKYMNPMDGELGRKPSELVDMVLSTKKCKKIFGWKPNIKLHDRLDEYIDCFRLAMCRNEIIIPKNKMELW